MERRSTIIEISYLTKDGNLRFKETYELRLNPLLERSIKRLIEEKQSDGKDKIPTYIEIHFSNGEHDGYCYVKPSFVRELGYRITKPNYYIEIEEHLDLIKNEDFNGMYFWGLTDLKGGKFFS